MKPAALAQLVVASVFLGTATAVTQHLIGSDRVPLGVYVLVGLTLGLLLSRPDPDA